MEVIKNNLNQLILKKISIISLAGAFNGLLILIAVLIEKKVFEEWIIFFAFISIFQLLFNIFLLKLVGEELFSLSSLFLIFSYLFHFGHVFLIGFHIDLGYPTNFLSERVSTEIIRKASQFTLYVQAFVAIGMMLMFITPITSKRIPQKKLNPKFGKQITKYMGMVCILIGIIPMIYIDITKILAFFENGYIATFDIKIRNIYILARLTIVGVMLLMIANKDNKKLTTFLMSITLLYEFLTMLSGGRGHAVINILTFIYFYVKVIKKIQLKSLLVYLFLGYFAVIFINTISIYRKSTGDFNSFITILSNQNILNPINDMIYEFGGTLLSVCLSIFYFPQYAPIQWGYNYFISIFTWLPSNIGNPFVSKVEYTTFFPGSDSMYLGGSYIGELFYSFNYWGIFISIFIGSFVAYVSKKIKESIINENSVSLVIGLILFSDILWWVRDYFGGMLREFVWISLFLFLLYLIIYNIMLRNINTN